MKNNKGFLEIGYLIAAGLIALGIIGVNVLKDNYKPVVIDNSEEVAALNERIAVLQEQSNNQGIQLGSFNTVAAKPTKLGGSGLASTDTTINLVDLETPNGASLTMTDFGEIGYGTIEPNRTNKEFISFTGITQNADGTAALTGVTRGLNFVSPYTASTTLRKAHPGGSAFVISNPPQLYNEFTGKTNDESISGSWIFDTLPVASSSIGTSSFTNNQHFASKLYVDSVTAAGAAPITEITAGIGLLANKAQMAAGTATGSYSGTTYNLVVPSSAVNATSSATSSIVMSRPDGKIAVGYLPTSDDLTFDTSVITVSSSDIFIEGTGVPASTNETMDITGMAVNFSDSVITIGASDSGDPTQLIVDGTAAFSYTNTFNTATSTFNGPVVVNGTSSFVKWEFMSSSSVSGAAPAAAKAATIDVAGRSGNCTTGGQAQLTVFKTGQTSAIIKDVCNNASYWSAAASWSGSSVAVTHSADTGLTGTSTTYYFYK